MQARIRNSVSSLSFSAPVRNRSTNNNIDQEQGDINFYVENHFGKKTTGARRRSSLYQKKCLQNAEIFVSRQLFSCGLQGVYMVPPSTTPPGVRRTSAPRA